MSRCRRLDRLKHQRFLFTLLISSTGEHGDLISVLQLASCSDDHLDVAVLPEFAEHVVLEGWLIHGAAGVEGTLIACARPGGAVPAHVHVAVGRWRVRARYLRAHLARLRRVGRPAARLG